MLHNSRKSWPEYMSYVPCPVYSYKRKLSQKLSLGVFSLVFEKTRHFYLKLYSTSHSTRIYTLSQVSQVFTCSTNCKHLTLHATILHVGGYLTYVHNDKGLINILVSQSIVIMPPKELREA